MRINRRQFHRAMGLGALFTTNIPSYRAFAEGNVFPSRIVFFVQPHAHVANSWKLTLPGLPTDTFVEQSLRDLSVSEFSTVLKPLHAYRDRLLVVEGLAHTSVLMDIAEVKRANMNGDANNHSIAVAGLLSGARALQTPGLTCTGGARTLDQELALRTAAPGRFGSRVYGSDYVPNLTVAPFSFLGAGQATPMVKDPATAFADLLGYHRPNSSGGALDREQKIGAMRSSVLDAVAQEYRTMANLLGIEGRQKLESHRTLIRELEMSLDATPRVLAGCDPNFDSAGHTVDQFMRLIKMAFSCDLTRVAVFSAPVPQPPEFGYPANANVHAGYAHASVQGDTSCGTTFSKLAENAMTDLGVWYARHFAALLQHLDSVPEGSGTLLDHTVVVWLNELGSPTHRHHDTFTLLAGDCNNFFRTGRYLRYPGEFISPTGDAPVLGPAHNRLFVSLLQSMGQNDTSFGMTEALSANGKAISLRGPLSELHVVK
jgi:Protein of unknown function (DUF1552)